MTPELRARFALARRRVATVAFLRGSRGLGQKSEVLVGLVALVAVVILISVLTLVGGARPNANISRLPPPSPISSAPPSVLPTRTPSASPPRVTPLPLTGHGNPNTTYELIPIPTPKCSWSPPTKGSVLDPQDWPDELEQLMVQIDAPVTDAYEALGELMHRFRDLSARARATAILDGLDVYLRDWEHESQGLACMKADIFERMIQYGYRGAGIAFDPRIPVTCVVVRPESTLLFVMTHDEPSRTLRDARGETVVVSGPREQTYALALVPESHLGYVVVGWVGRGMPACSGPTSPPMITGFNAHRILR